MIALGIDPGLVVTGVCALDGRRVHYRASIRTPSHDSDEVRADFITRSVLEALGEVSPDVVCIEGYEYQGRRSHTENAIRISLLVGRIIQAAKSWANDRGARVEVVNRTVWGHAIGVMTDVQRERRIKGLEGIALKNEHEKDAACLAVFGQTVAGMRRSA